MIKIVFLFVLILFYIPIYSFHLEIERAREGIIRTLQQISYCLISPTTSFLKTRPVVETTSKT